jgi:replicative DNA helicase
MASAILPPLAEQEAERHLLGAMMLQPAAAEIAANVVAAPDFYEVRHQWLFEAIAACDGNANEFTVAERLRAMGRLDDVGGESYIAELMEQTPPAIRARRYAEIIVDRAERRRILSALSETAKATHNLERPVPEVYSAAVAHFAAAARSIAAEHMDRQMIAERALVSFDERAEAAGRLLGWPTGVADLDRMTGGWQRNCLITIAGRPGSGKSVLLGQSSLRAAAMGAKVHHYTLEMSPEAVLIRMAKCHAQVGFGPTEVHKLSDDHKGRFRHAVAQISAMPLFIHTTSAIQHIIAECEIESRRENLDMVVVDYLQIATPDIGRREASTRDVELSASTRALKQMAGRLAVPVLIGSQLNRQADGVKPTMAMLRESGGIENDSDVIVMLWTPDPDHQPNIVEASVAKNREDTTGDVKMYFAKPMHRFGDVAKVNP